jgi:hypothetical protein
MHTHVASVVTAKEGDVLRFYQAFTDFNCTEQQAVPISMTLAPLTAKAVNFAGMAVVSRIFLKTDRPVHVQMTFAPTAPTPPLPPGIDPTPTQPAATQTVLVDKLLSLVSQISSMTVTNANSGATPTEDAHVEILIVGT